MVTSAGTGKRVVLTAVGSLGDLHPFLAIALGLKARGHDAIVATSECYRQKVLNLGLGFRPIRPDSEVVSNPDVMRRFMDMRWGTERVIRGWLLPILQETYEDTLAAAQGADLLVPHVTNFAARLVAEKEGIRWVSTMVSPSGFFSAVAPSLLPGYPGLSKALRFLGPAFWGPLGHILKRATRHWARPWYQLRRELGLPPTAELNPLVDGHSPWLHLALFSKWLADKQPDWPAQTVITGFPFHDGDGTSGLPPDLARFLDEGPPPIVFTLGSSAAAIAGSFYEQSAAAAQRVGRRAVLILGDPRNQPLSLPEGVAAFNYAPFAALLPRASVLVFPGGVGTTGLTMRSGLPALVVPLAHDQPDNADRLARMGIARSIDRRRYSADRVAKELDRLLGIRATRGEQKTSAPSCVRKMVSPPRATPSRPCLPTMPRSSGACNSMVFDDHNPDRDVVLLESERGQWPSLVNRAGCSTLALTLAAGEVIKKGTVELPRVELIDCGLGVGQRAPGDAQEVDRPIQVVPPRSAADVQVGVAGQRSARAHAGSAGVFPAVDVDRERACIAVGLGDDVVPLPVVDSAMAGQARGGASSRRREGHAARIVDGQGVSRVIHLLDQHCILLPRCRLEVRLDEEVGSGDLGVSQVGAAGPCAAP